MEPEEISSIILKIKRDFTIIDLFHEFEKKGVWNKVKIEESLEGLIKSGRVKKSGTSKQGATLFRVT